MKFLKKIPLLLLSLLVMAIIFVFIWCYLPKEEVALDKLNLSDNFVFLKLSLDKKSFSLLDEAVDFKFGQEFLVNSLSERLLFKIGTRFFSPLTLVLLVNRVKEDKFEYTLLIKSRKLSRFIEIPLSVYTKFPSFKKSYKFKQSFGWSIWSEKEGNLKLKSFAKYGDICIFSTTTLDIEKLLMKFNSLAKDKTSHFQYFFENSYRKPLLIYINDEERILNFYLAKAKEKTSYDFFPTISDLNEVFIYFGETLSNQERGGQMKFAFKERADFKKARGDIWFFSQVLKRIFEANFYEFRYDLRVVKNCVIMDFALRRGGR
jgi:hypothetical protein